MNNVPMHPVRDANGPAGDLPPDDAPLPEPHTLSADDFERRVRLRYRQATTQLSTRTQAQLQQRVRAATAPRTAARRSHRLAWCMAAACSLALVIGLGRRLQAPGNGLQTAPAPPAVASDSGELVGTLDETPDLYLWVASDDAAAMTSE